MVSNYITKILYTALYDEDLYSYLEIHGVQYLEGMKRRWTEEWVATVVSICQVFRLPVNQLILWGRIKAAPLGITQVLTKAPQ